VYRPQAGDLSGGFASASERNISMLKTFVRGLIILWLGGLFSALILVGSQVFAEVKNTQQAFSFSIVLSEKKSQLAIWLTDEQGVFVDTIYVTRKVAKNGLGNRSGGIDGLWGGPV